MAMGIMEGMNFVFQNPREIQMPDVPQSDTEVTTTNVLPMSDAEVTTTHVLPMISEPVESIINQIVNQDVWLKTLDGNELERTRQDEYLHLYGLYRQPILGDGNCLFRSISLALYGHQDHHQNLRNLAINEIEQNLDIFGMFFIRNDNSLMNITEIHQELGHLRQLGTFAGQESILALSRHFGINILVTFGGDTDNPNFATHEHDFQNSRNRIHLVWTRAGGGHYETVNENLPRSTETQNFLGKNFNRSKSDYIWNLDFPGCRKIDLEVCCPDNKFNEAIPLPSSQADHIKSFHSYDHDQADGKKCREHKNTCIICFKSFKDKSNLNRHVKNVHEKGNEKRICCLVHSCDLQFFHIENLINHLIDSHEADISVETLTFKTIDLFNKFVQDESIKANIRFVQHRQKTFNKDGSHRYILVCHRDGKKRTLKEQKGRKRKEFKKGSCKLGNLCLSRLSVLVSKDGDVKVKYIKSHSHSLNFEQSKYLPIPDHIKSEISTMLALNIPINTILNKIREKFCERDNREDLTDLKHYHLIDRKTIHNLKQKIVDSSVIRHSDDATSTFLRVDALRKEKFDPILIYKPQGEIDQIFGLNRNDFMLALMTKQQLEMYEKFAPVIICLDSTHKTNTYSFKLITLLVPDEFRHGYPVAFCISNREDEDSLSIFLNSVKSKAPNTKVKFMMTDDDIAGWNAAKNVFGDINHFLCIWHIHKNWRLKIKQHIKDNEQQAQIYCLLCAALETKNENGFNQYITILTDKLSQLCPPFLEYFSKYYLTRKEKWAMCFRTGEYGNVNTNMYLESFHNQLKTIYFDGKRNRRIDILIETLLQIENNLYFKHLKSDIYNIPSDKDVQTLDRHQASFDIPDSSINQVNEKKISILSNSNLYTISQLHKNCPESHCFYKCKKIPCFDLCRHILSCNCYDFNEGNICKHIHKIQSLLNQDKSSQISDECAENVQVFKKNNSSDVRDQAPSKFSVTSKVQCIKERLDKIFKQVNTNQFVQDNRLDNIISALDFIISANDGSEQLSTLSHMKKTEKIASNANNILQPRFKSTINSSGRKKKHPFKKPSLAEKSKLLGLSKSDGQLSLANNTQGQRSGPSVAPYPSLHLVPPTQPTIIQPQGQVPLVNLEQELPSSFRIPPSLLGRRVTIIGKDGKQQQIIFSKPPQNFTEMDSLDS